MKVLHLGTRITVLFCLAIASAITEPAQANDTLTDILRAKGILTKEDWIRIEAEKEKMEATAKKKQGGESDVKISWGKKGFGLATKDGLFKTNIQWRFQGRWTYPERSDPTSSSAFSDNAESSFELRRVRMKVGGHGYQPWINYYLEVEWQAGRGHGDDSARAHTRLLDWRIMLEKYPWAKLRLGQWKINYNRERVDSSGKQTFVERSIVNKEFTIDRQIGAMLYGRLNPTTPVDMHYYVGVFSGAGRGVKDNDDDNMMYMGRLQWNFMGRELKWTQSDLKYHKYLTGNIALAGYTNIGKCTRWSSSGCGNLSSNTSLGASFFSPSNARDGQFRVDGIMEEVAFKYRGLAFQHEYHWKTVRDSGTSSGDTAAPSTTSMMGSYTNIGYFPHYLIPSIPKQLETAFRYAFVDPDTGTSGDFRQEFTGAANWFFAGHRNKLTLDVSHLTLDHQTSDTKHEQRIRLQWDVSF